MKRRIEKVKIYRYGMISALICVIFGMLYKPVDHRVPERNDAWKSNKVIAHALGAIDDKKITGSLEAFKVNYERGIRCFEVDMIFTADGDIVLAHDWKSARKKQPGLPEEEVPTTEEFLSNQIYDKYTPMTFRDLCQLMKEYPDVYVVTDSKYVDVDNIEKEFNQVLDIAEELDAREILDRFVIQVYTKEMYEDINKIYPFSSWLITLYKVWDGDIATFKDYCRWCVANNIMTITIKQKYVTQEVLDLAKGYGIDVYTHTINDPETVKSLEEMGIAGVYSDFLSEADLYSTEN